jgi:hypothetical protein
MKEQNRNISSPHPSGPSSNWNETGPVWFNRSKSKDERAMIAALGTLAFLTTLWLLVVVGAAVLEESGAKIAAALKGKPAHHRSIGLVAVRVRTRQRLQPTMRARPRMRAAA